MFPDSARERRLPHKMQAKLPVPDCREHQQWQSGLLHREKPTAQPEVQDRSLIPRFQGVHYLYFLWQSAGGQ